MLRREGETHFAIMAFLFKEKMYPAITKIKLVVGPRIAIRSFSSLSCILLCTAE